MRTRLALGGVAAAGLLLAAAGLLLAGWAGWRAGPGSDAPAAVRVASGPAGAAAGAPPEAAGTSEVAGSSGGALPPLPASLAGTEVDGALVVDSDGRFVVTRDALDLFDYFLAASGEEPASVLRARIAREIDARLPPAARPAARDLLDRYLAYREAVRALSESEHMADRSLERRFQRIRELRRAHFDPREREALFAAEEERWRIELERRRVALEPGLSPEARRARLDDLEARLPEDVREARRAALAASRLREDEAALRAEGASEAEIHALREERFGAEAAARLAALDRRRARWNARVEAWRAERARLAASGATAEEIARARAERFEGPEKTRVEALERLESR